METPEGYLVIAGLLVVVYSVSHWGMHKFKWLWVSRLNVGAGADDGDVAERAEDLIDFATEIR